MTRFRVGFGASTWSEALESVLARLLLLLLLACFDRMDEIDEPDRFSPIFVFLVTFVDCFLLPKNEADEISGLFLQSTNTPHRRQS